MEGVGVMKDEELEEIESSGAGMLRCSHTHLGTSDYDRLGCDNRCTCVLA